jgi:predicted nucleic acid-binding protein
MKHAADGPIVVIVDTSCLINFLIVDRMDLFGALSGYAFVVPNHVVAEVTDATERTRLAAAMTAGVVTEIEITDLAEIELYVALRRILGDGESACLAVAATRGWVMAADEKGRLRREAYERLGEANLVNTPGILVSVIQEEILTAEGAEALRAVLATHRFVMDIPPFAELVGEQRPCPPPAQDLG